MAKPTYLWRKLTSRQREELMAWRKRQGLPWHRPPHRASEKTYYHVSAACFEHKPHVGFSRKRLEEFCEELLRVLQAPEAQIHAWCVLPNHYHTLIGTSKILEVLREMGRMHGRLSFKWNGEEKNRGRQVWCGAVERYLRDERHFWATMNYVHNNPVRHGYVVRWQEWPFSSAQEYLEEMGREFAEKMWRLHPVLEYGKGWDDPGL
jgi:putative transposase